jgi:putative oxidoreductase
MSFGGGGIRGTASLFTAWGLHPAPVMVAVARGMELAGAALIASGAAAILGAAGTMLVAGSVSWRRGLWAAKGGYELQLLYGLVALVIGVTGPGRYSIDKTLELPGYSGIGFTACAAVLGLIGDAPLLIRVRRSTKKLA